MAGPPGGEFEVLRFTVKIDGQEEESVVPIKDNDNIFMSIPEGTKYTTTIHFVVHKPVKNLKYIQIATKGGITVRKTERFLGESFEPREEPYSVEFDEETTPSGFFFRGQTPMKSTYYLDGVELYTADWTVEITKK